MHMSVGEESFLYAKSVNPSPLLLARKTPHTPQNSVSHDSTEHLLFGRSCCIHNVHLYIILFYTHYSEKYRVFFFGDIDRSLIIRLIIICYALVVHSYTHGCN